MKACTSEKSVQLYIFMVYLHEVREINACLSLRQHVSTPKLFDKFPIKFSTGVQLKAAGRI
jgi:hypothetical protein